MKAKRNRLNRFKTDDKGTSLIELAVVLPVLLTIGLGIMEFGNMIYRQHLIVNGVRDAARYASGRPYDAANTAQTTNISTAAANIAATGTISGGTNRISWWAPGAVSVTYTTVANGPTSCGSSRCYRPIRDVAIVTVSTSVAYQPLGFLGYLEQNAITLTASHQERVIGVR